MLAIRKILFPIDFSDRSAGAAHFVEAMAGRFQAEVTMLHVIEPNDYVFGPMEFGSAMVVNYHAEHVALTRKLLDSYLDKELAHFDVKHVLREGDAAHEIANFARENQFDLIMMPTHGFGTFRRFIIGSVTAKVLHDSDVPVWTGVHMEAAPPLEAIQTKNVLCALDLGPGSLATLKWAGEMCEEYGARLCIVHAAPAYDARPAKYFDAELFQTQAAEARKDIEALCKDAEVQADICVHGGNPADVVREAAETHHSDLLVIGRGAVHEGLGRLRAHAYSIIRQSPCPVISV